MRRVHRRRAMFIVPPACRDVQDYDRKKMRSREDWYLE